MTTTYLDGILPGLVAKYGEDKAMSLKFSTHNAPNALFNVGQVGAQVNYYLDFWVEDQIAVSLNVTNANALVQASLDNFIMKLKIDLVKFEDISVLKSEIGEVSGRELKYFLNTLFRMLIPFINGLVLADGFPIPDTFFGVMRIKSAKFNSMNGYVDIGFVPEFI